MSAFTHAKFGNMMLVINISPLSSEILISFPFSEYKSQANRSETIQQLWKHSIMLPIKIQMTLVLKP